MKSRVILSLVIFAVYHLSYAQNLVPNPSFEEIVDCPDMIGEVFLAEPWYVSLESPDLFNTCFEGKADGLDVPINARGFQDAIDEFGNIGLDESYAGIFVYRAITKVGDEREFMGVPLICPMIIGNSYDVSFFASRCDNYSADCAASGIGVRFSTTQHTIDNPLSTDNISHIYSTEIIEDKENWTLIEGTFVADSAYSFMHVGNFFDDANTDTLECISFGSYYIDMFSVVPLDSTECFIAMEENLTGTISMYPNPCDNHFSVSSNKIITLITFHDIYGRECLKLSPNLFDINLKVNNLIDGIYLVSFEFNDNSRKNTSLLIQH